MIIIDFLNWLSGSYNIRIDKRFSDKTINLLFLKGIKYSEYKIGESEVCFTILRKDYKKFEKLSNEENIEYTVERKRGLPNLLFRYRKRIGLPLGAVIMFILLYVSQFFIWDITVTGNVKVSSKEITMLLETLGCKVGAYIPKINFENLTNDYLMMSDNISWISVNMNGTVANVEVKERLTAKRLYSEGECVNLVAECDGQIKNFTVFSGMRVVNVGDSVKKGELLVSGITAMKDESEVIEGAEGNVYAEVLKTFTVNVPKNYTENVYTGHSEVKRSVKIFGKSINLFINSRILMPKYDKIINEEDVYVLDNIKLPVKLTTCLYNETETVSKTRSEEECRALGTVLLENIINESVNADEIIERYDSEILQDDSVKYTSVILYVKDIAKKSEFSAENS